MGVGNVQAQELKEYQNFRGETVLVFVDSADQLLERGYLVEYAVKEIDYDLNERWTHNPESSASPSSGYAGTLPEFHIDLPKYVTVGDEFEINIPYTWVFFDTEDGTIPVEEAEVDYVIESNGPNPWSDGHAGVSYHMAYPQEMKLLSDPETYYDFVERDVQWDVDRPHWGSLMIYDISEPHNMNMRFLLNDTVNYPHNNVYMQVGMTFHNYYLNQVDSATYEISKELVIPNFGPGGEPKPPYPLRVGAPANNESPGISENMPMLPNMTEFAYDLEHGGVDWTELGHENIEDMLRELFPHEWVEEFLEQFPQYRPNFILPVLNWILPEAYGQSPSYAIVRGDIKIEELPRRFVNPTIPVSYCVFDDNLSNRNSGDRYTMMTKFGSNTPACDELENGRFTILVNKVDPNGDGTNPDYVIGILLENEFLKLTPHGEPKTANLYQKHL